MIINKWDTDFKQIKGHHLLTKMLINLSMCASISELMNSPVHFSYFRLAGMVGEGAFCEAREKGRVPMTARVESSLHYVGCPPSLQGVEAGGGRAAVLTDINNVMDVPIASPTRLNTCIDDVTVFVGALQDRHKRQKHALSLFGKPGTRSLPGGAFGTRGLGGLSGPVELSLPTGCYNVRRLVIALSERSPTVRHPLSCSSSSSSSSQHTSSTNAPLLLSVNFLHEWMGLTELDLSGLAGVRVIPDGFLRDCNKLRSVDLSPLASVEVINNRFLAECSSLTEIDLTPFAENLKSIGPDFLTECSSLTTIDVTPLGAITALPRFLNGCRSLVSFDSTPLKSLRVIYGSFLAGCTHLQSVCLQGLHRITSTPFHFLTNCASLQSVDLRPLSNLTHLSGGFLSGCTSLASLDLSPLSNVRVVETGFLAGCTSLAAIDISPLRNVQVINTGFLAGCSSLKSLDLAPLNQVTAIGMEFLQNCSSLVSLDLCPLCNVAGVGSGFLNGCSSLTLLDLAPLGAVKGVLPNFLRGCDGLQQVVIGNSNHLWTSLPANIRERLSNCPLTNTPLQPEACDVLDFDQFFC